MRNKKGTNYSRVKNRLPTYVQHANNTYLFHLVSATIQIKPSWIQTETYLNICRFVI
jgi:hypothetical protein